MNVVLDHKIFDYSKVKGPLLAVPKSVFVKMYSSANKSAIESPYFRTIKLAKKTTAKIKKTGTGWKVTTDDIVRGIALAKKERKEGKLIYL